MNMKDIGIFCGGLVAGAVASFVACKQYYKKKYEAEREQLEDYYRAVDKYARVEHDDPDEDNDVNPNEEDAPVGGRMSPEQRAEIKRKLQDNHRRTTNYAGMYREKNGYTEEKLAEAQHPLDQGEDGEEDPADLEENCRNCFRCSGEGCSENREEFDYQAIRVECPAYVAVKDMVENEEEERAFNEHQKNKGRAPKIITAEAYSALGPEIDQQVLYFYAYDQTVADENEEVVEDYERLLGNCLTKYGFMDSDERLIFVMNYELSTCYEVQKIDQSWTETH